MLPAYTALGFISRSAFLDKIKDALDVESDLAKLAVTPSFKQMLWNLLIQRGEGKALRECLTGVVSWALRIQDKLNRKAESSIIMRRRQHDALRDF